MGTKFWYGIGLLASIAAGAGSAVAALSAASSPVATMRARTRTMR